MRSNIAIQQRITILENILEFHEKPEILKTKIPKKEYEVVINSDGEWFITYGYSPSLIGVLKAIKSQTTLERVSDFNETLKNNRLCNKYATSSNIEDYKKIKFLNPNLLINKILCYCWIFELCEWGKTPEKLEEKYEFS